MKKCQFCGYEMKKYSGCLNSDTRYNGKPCHKTCLENKLRRDINVGNGSVELLQAM